MYPLITPFQYHTRSSSQCNNTRKGNKNYKDWEGKNKSVFIGDIIVSVENLKQLTKKTKTSLLELINDCSKVVGYKVNIQKSITFLYTNNEQMKFEI